MGAYIQKELEGILSRFGDMVYRFAFVQVKKREIADDIYQEVWLRFIRQKGRLESDEHIRAWLLRTTLHCCRDYWKSAWVRRIIWRDKEDDTLSEIGITAEENTAELAEGPVTACVQCLSEKYRTVIHLYYYEEYSLKEIAGLLGVKENTIASRLARGREQLKQMLSEEERRHYGY